MEKTNRDISYYMETVKFVRDLVHGYVFLTKFELEIIDTFEFQRLKDIRQLTCQHVYPAARHTRFEHSLGVLELTRQAIKHLNRNGILIQDEKRGNGRIFDSHLQFNATLAALLHDVGHCPLSHLGEVEFNKDEVWEALCEAVNKCPELSGSTLKDAIDEINKKGSKRPGAVHEQMSCVVILTKFYELLAGVKNSINALPEDTPQFHVDFELLIRSIIGLKYCTGSKDEYQENREKNVVVDLINSPIFDMDKLDYIMRDSLLTGIGNPDIDTHRLFKNMYLNSETEYTLVFTHRAEPVLQNMIEARDKLYMYVYNHHAAVFSDFMCSYIFRRLDHNARDFISLPCTTSGEATAKIKLDKPQRDLALVPKGYLFSSDAVSKQMRSDSDMISLLRDLYCFATLDGKNEHELEEALRSVLEKQGVTLDREIEIGVLVQNIQRGFQLVEKYQRREFLKPWWKTNFEFTDFISHHFRDDHIRKRLCSWICGDEKDAPDSDEFCSQLAKHIIYITQALKKEGTFAKKLGLLEDLEDGDFFIIKRAAHFFVPDAINQIDIAIQNSEILGAPGEVKSKTKHYYIKELANVLPQRDYYSLYVKESFYVFSKPVREKDAASSEARRRHYHLLEQIFVYVATNLVKAGARDFKEKFLKSAENIKENENMSFKNMTKGFVESKGYKWEEENEKDNTTE